MSEKKGTNMKFIHYSMSQTLKRYRALKTKRAKRNLAEKFFDEDMEIVLEEIGRFIVLFDKYVKDDE